VIVHDLSDPSAGAATVTVRGSSPVLEEKGHGFEWDPVSEQFVGWGGGAEVWTLVPPDGDWRTQSWTWLRVDPAQTNTVVPTAPNTNGTYSRWRYVPSLNVFVVVNAIDEPVYAYRLAADPGVGPNDDDTGTSGGLGETGDGDTTTAPGSGDGGAPTTTSGPPGTDGTSTNGTATSDAAPPAAGEGSGCGCRASRGSDRFAFAILLALIAAARRRRLM
jgi:MYXO-CTERM domain-containing protein